MVDERARQEGRAAWLGRESSYAVRDRKSQCIVRRWLDAWQRVTVMRAATTVRKQCGGQDRHAWHRRSGVQAESGLSAAAFKFYSLRVTVVT